MLKRILPSIWGRSFPERRELKRDIVTGQCSMLYLSGGGGSFESPLPQQMDVESLHELLKQVYHLGYTEAVDEMVKVNS